MTTPYQDAPFEEVNMDRVGGVFVDPERSRYVEKSDGTIVNSGLPRRYVFENGEYVEVFPSEEDLPSTPSRVS